MPKRKCPIDDQGWSGRDPRSIITSDFGCEDICFSEPSIINYQTLCTISGSSVSYRTLCTSSEGRPCDIFKDLTIWNECFWHVSLELRELYPGQLSLVNMDKPRFPSEAQRREAATLLHCLLTYHRCLVSVVLNEYIFDGHHQIIFHALPKSPSLRKLEVRLFVTFTPAYQSFSTGLPLLNHLQELDCQVMDLDRSFCEGLSKLLLSTTSLTTLTLSASDLRTRDAVVIFRGLKSNRTVTTLSLGRRVSVILSQCAVECADYLRENQKLRRLIVTSYCSEDDSVPNLIIRSLFGTTALSEVSLVDFSLDNENSRLVAEMLSENRSLRAFHMVQCGLYRSGRFPESVGVSGRICPWLIALGKNTTLERLTMDFSCFNLEECWSLFKTLASNKSLKSITVDDVPTVEICRALRETGLLERFSFPKPHKVKDPVVTLRECKGLSSINIRPRNLRGFRPLHTALSMLPSCSHVTSLFLVCQPLDGDAISLMVKYIAGTTVLRHLEMTKIYFTLDTEDRAQRALMQALSINKSIRKLSMKDACLDETEIQILVDKLQATQTLCELFFYPDDFASSNSLIQKLSPRVSSNYTLLGLKTEWANARHEDMFAVDNVVRRNLALVTRAAYFVMGTRQRYCAEAAELVHWNPGLVAKVQALASVDESEAVSRIQNSLKSFSELDDFMCVAGVVKCGVTCYKRDDGQLQLTDLNRDCWLHIRQHLKMGDILDAR